ncbi:MAG: hypothetical protein ACOYMW_00310 [Candidatus Competibacteraceae bacterium]
MDMPNVLSHLVSDENSMTNLLKAVCALKPIREVVIRLFTADKFGTDEVDFEDLSTQQSVGGAIPDMCIQIDNKLAVAVEIKTSDWRLLTVNQPTTYLQWLNSQTGDKFFVFLVAPNYLAQHRQTYSQRKQQYIASYPKHGITFIEIDWLDLRSKLQETELSSCCVYARDFENLIESWYLPTPIKFTVVELKETKMFNKTAGISLYKMFGFVQGMEVALTKQGFKVVKAYRNFGLDGEFAVYVHCGDQLVLWLGIWPSLWQDHGWPLAVGVDQINCPPSVVSRFGTFFPNHIVYPPNNSNPYLVTPIDESLLGEDAVRDVLKFLNPYLDGICGVVNGTDQEIGITPIVE